MPKWKMDGFDYKYYDTDTKFIKTLYDNLECSSNGHCKHSTRLVNKDGSYSVEHEGYPDAWKRRWRNAFQAALEVRWRYVWMFSISVYPFTWCIFAFLYYLTAYFNGDFSDYPTNFQVGNDTIPIVDHVPCIVNIKNFLSFFLYSLETQQTIGYGARYNTEQCYFAVVVLGLQVIFGTVLQACLCAVVWARMLRPKRRGEEIVFSKCACVALNDQGELCLMFRMSDISGNILITSSVRLYVAVKKRLESTPDIFSFKLHHMSMGEEDGSDKLLFLWPIVASHVINNKSPLYAYSKEDLEKSNLEFIAVAEGIVETTGLTVQIRTSYLPHEILWGYRFRPMNFCEREPRHVKVRILYEDFDAFVKVDSPSRSAKELDDIRARKGILINSAKRFDSVENLRRLAPPPTPGPPKKFPFKKRYTVTSL